VQIDGIVAKVRSLKVNSGFIGYLIRHGSRREYLQKAFGVKFTVCLENSESYSLPVVVYSSTNGEVEKAVKYLEDLIDKEQQSRISKANSDIARVTHFPFYINYVQYHV